MKKFNNALLGLGIMLLAACAEKKKTAAGKEGPPNLLFIAVDDLNNWSGLLNGHPNTKTSNMV